MKYEAPELTVLAYEAEEALSVSVLDSGDEGSDWGNLTR